MKIRYIIFIIATYTLSATRGFAQEKDPSIYIKLYGGYSLLAPGSNHPEPDLELASGIGQTGSYYTKGRLGEGLNYGFGLEKDMSSVLMVGIDFNYLDGKKATTYFNTNKGTILYASSQQTSFPPFGPLTRTSTTTHSVLSFIPNVSFKVFKQSTYFVYTKLGIIVAAH